MIQQAAALPGLTFQTFGRDSRYYLTYHRFATRQQVEACYPQFAEFLRMKLKYDPEEVFQGEWYRHYKKMFGIGSPAPA